MAKQCVPLTFEVSILVDPKWLVWYVRHTLDGGCEFGDNFCMNHFFFSWIGRLVYP